MHPDLSWTQWTPKEIDAAATAALVQKRAGLDAVLTVPDSERAFANTIGALERSGDRVSDVQQEAELLMAVHPDAAVRDAAQHTIERIEAALVEMEYDRRLWAAVQTWVATNEQLDPIDRKLADDTLRDMRRRGFALSDADFAELKRTVTELKKLETEFEKAINDWKDHIEVTCDQLAGMPERYIEGLKRSGDNYLVTLEYPDLFPFMRMADDENARRELATKNLHKGGPENLERLAQMIRLRQRHAQLLGYATHADFQCEPRMAKTAAAVKEFLDDIAGKLIPAARRELADLVAIKQRTLRLEKPAPIHFYETAYWSNKSLKERYDVDSEQVKEYFPLARVLEGMFRVYQDLLGLQFSLVPNVELWHPDTKLYEMHDGQRLIGHFALDLHPREGKYGHAASFSPTSGFMVLVCNFPRDPGLLSHLEVETLFHEFGHVCHGLLSNGRWKSENGLCAALDFVEMPSQLFEEWAWTSIVPIPNDLFKKLLAARQHMQANYYLQQAVHALYDVRIHSQPTNTPVEPAHLAQLHRNMTLEYEAMVLPDDSIFVAGWGHMADYDAGYYSYLWSKVYALDMYTRFAADPLDRNVGKEYRTKVLEPGASKPEMELVRAFLGREPNDAAFLTCITHSSMKEVGTDAHASG